MRSRFSLTTRRRAAGALALGACALGVAATPAAAAVSPCKSSQLVTWLNTQSNGAAGTIYYALNFTNVGARCTLRGYPGVSAVGRAGKRLGTAATHSTVKPTRTITLNAANARNGSFSTVHATLGIVEAGVYSSSRCGPTIASGLRVFAPNQSTATFVPFPFGACARSGPKFLNVTTVVK